MTIIRYGVHQQLEDAATELIRKSLEGVTSMSAKSDILTPWKEKDRRDREVYNPAGVPDASVRKGMYHRVYNPAQTHLNSREGIAPARRIQGSLESHVDVHARGPYHGFLDGE